MKSSSGADEMVNGCHSMREISGQLRKRYWPDLYFIDGFFICTSTTLEGCWITLDTKVCRLRTRAAPPSHYRSPKAKRQRKRRGAALAESAQRSYRLRTSRQMRSIM